MDQALLLTECIHSGLNDLTIIHQQQLQKLLEHKEFGKIFASWVVVIAHQLEYP